MNLREAYLTTERIYLEKTKENELVDLEKKRESDRKLKALHDKYGVLFLRGNQAFDE